MKDRIVAGEVSVSNWSACRGKTEQEENPYPTQSARCAAAVVNPSQPHGVCTLAQFRLRETGTGRRDGRDWFSFHWTSDQ